MSTNVIEQKPPDLLPSTIRARPASRGWMLVAVFGICWLGIFSLPFLPPKSSGAGFWWLWGVWQGIILLITLALACWLLRAEVRADERGLWWRRLGGWKGVSWRDVEDYYEELKRRDGSHTMLEQAAAAPPGQSLPAGQVYVSSIIRTGRGKITLSHGLWSGVDSLRELVSRHADRALAKSWGVRGARPEDPWPRHFDYRTPDSRWTAPAIILGLSLFAAWWVGRAAVKMPSMVHEMGWAWAAGFLAVYCSVALAPIALYGAMLTPYLDARRRWNQRLTADLEGLTFQDGQDLIYSRWEDVTGYYLGSIGRILSMPSVYIVETRDGVIRFTTVLRDAHILKAIIQQQAKNSSTSAWRHLENEVLEDRRSHTIMQSGEFATRLFHYHTRTNRALLWYAASLSLGVGIAIPLRLYVLAEHQGLAMPIIALLLSAAAALWAWWRYRAAGILLHREGITQYAPSGPRTVRWEDIQEYYLADGGLGRCGVVSSRQTGIRFLLVIAYAEELQAEIARRAINSRTKTWEKRGALLGSNPHRNGSQ